ncbi:MAG: hypothetical protein FWE13_03300 [Firmicutes bacterium]|nr:hypothetical protein [Bacillota bacterium]
MENENQNQNEIPQMGTPTAENQKKSKKEKKVFDDPGISYTNMNVPGMRYYDKHKDNPGSQIQLSKRERRRLIRAGFLSMMPRLILMVLGFSMSFFIVMLWFTCASGC